MILWKPQYDAQKTMDYISKTEAPVYFEQVSILNLVNIFILFQDFLQKEDVQAN